MSHSTPDIFARKSRVFLVDDHPLVRDGLATLINQQADIGLTKIISSWFFHRPHIFDPNSRRRPKPEILIVLSYLLLMATVCAAFNFR